MKTSGIPPIRGKRGHLPDDSIKQQLEQQKNAPEQPKPGRRQLDDEICFSPLAEELKRQQEEMEEEFTQPLDELREEADQLIATIKESNRIIQESAKQWDKVTPKPAVAPSAYGLTVGAASNKLRQSSLKVGKVQREYSEHIKAGCVIKQVPAAGARTTKGSGVTLIVSKGPPPDSEKHSIVKKRDEDKSPSGKDEDQSADSLGSFVDYRSEDV